MKKTLVLFSGGMDSTFVMYMLLKNTDDEVTAILFETAEGSHNKISSPKIQNRHLPELVQELKKIRDFKFIIKQVADDDYDEEIMSHYYTYLVAYAAPFINDGTYDRIVTGRTWEQYNKKLVFDGKIGNPSSFAAQRLFKKLVKPGYVFDGQNDAKLSDRLYKLWNPLTTHEYYKEFNRWHAFTYLPENIRERTFSCNFPIIGEDKNDACGECYKCLWDELVQTLIKAGYNSQQIEEFRKNKCKEFGTDTRDAPMRMWLPLYMGKGKIFDDLDTKEKVKDFIADVYKGHYSVPAKFAKQKDSIWYMDDVSDVR